MKRNFASLLILTLLLSLCACGSSHTKPVWQEQYDLGVRYLSAGNYEQAVLAFEAAIRIDSRQADAYIALAEVYTKQNASEKAAAILEQAIGEIGNTDQLTAAFEALFPASDSAPDSSSEPSAPPTQDLSRTEREDYAEGTYVIREYNAAGTLAKESWYWANNILWYIDEYDPFGNRVSQIQYSDDGSVYVHHVWEYNAAGILTRYRSRSDDDERITEYNADENPVRFTCHSPDGTIYASTVWEYDASGNLLREIDKSNGWHRMDEYDAAGNKIRRTYYNNDGSVSDVYEYDVGGNTAN